nr:CP19k-like protein 2 [Megabalanus ajax]
MLSAHRLIACAAIAAAAALPIEQKYVHYDPPAATTAAPSTAAPSSSPQPDGKEEKLKPDFGFAIESKQLQTGSTSGGASISSTGSTQGSVSSIMDLSTDIYNLNISAVGNGGLSSSSASSGVGSFSQKAQINTDAGSIGTRRADLGTGTRGKASSRGNAGTVHKTAANVGLQGLETITFAEPGLQFMTRVAKRAGASSSTGHQGSTKDNGALTIDNKGATQLRRLKPDLDPTDPNESLSSSSQLKQTGRTTGMSSLSATGSTQDSGGTRLTRWSPSQGLNNSRDLSGNTGVSGNGAATGNGFFVQGVQANTELISTKDSLKVRTGIRGGGTTGGSAGIVEKAGAKGKATDVRIVTLADGSKQVRLVNNQKTTAATSSGLSVSSSGNGTFNAQNSRETEVKVVPLNLDANVLKVSVLGSPAEPIPTAMPVVMPTGGPQYNVRYISTELPSTEKQVPTAAPTESLPEAKGKPTPE